MKTTYRNGKNIQIKFDVQLNFPASITADELKWMEESLRLLIEDDAEKLWQKVLRDRK
jgi:hypothetical protein